MEKFYTVFIGEATKFSSTKEDKAVRESKTRCLTFKNLEAAKVEYAVQIDKANSKIGYTRRNNPARELLIHVHIAVNGMEMVDNFCYNVQYKDGEVSNPDEK